MTDRSLRSSDGGSVYGGYGAVMKVCIGRQHRRRSTVPPSELKFYNVDKERGTDACGSCFHRSGRAEVRSYRRRSDSMCRSGKSTANRRDMCDGSRRRSSRGPVMDSENSTIGVTIKRRERVFEKEVKSDTCSGLRHPRSCSRGHMDNSVDVRCNLGARTDDTLGCTGLRVHSCRGGQADCGPNINAPGDEDNTDNSVRSSSRGGSNISSVHTEQTQGGLSQNSPSGVDENINSGSQHISDFLNQRTHSEGGSGRSSQGRGSQNCAKISSYGATVRTRCQFDSECKGIDVHKTTEVGKKRSDSVGDAMELVVTALSHMQEAMHAMEITIQRTDQTVKNMDSRLRRLEEKVDEMDNQKVQNSLLEIGSTTLVESEVTEPTNNLDSTSEPWTSDLELSTETTLTEDVVAVVTPPDIPTTLLVDKTESNLTTLKMEKQNIPVSLWNQDKEWKSVAKCWKPDNQETTTSIWKFGIQGTDFPTWAHNTIPNRESNKESNVSACKTETTIPSLKWVSQEPSITSRENLIQGITIPLKKSASQDETVLIGKPENQQLRIPGCNTEDRKTVNHSWNAESQGSNFSSRTTGIQEAPNPPWRTDSQGGASLTGWGTDKEDKWQTNSCDTDVSAGQPRIRNTPPRPQTGVPLPSTNPFRERRPLQTTPLQATPLQTTPVPATPLQATPLQATPLQATPLQATPLQATPLQATPLQATPLQATPLQATPLQATPLQKVAPRPQPTAARSRPPSSCVHCPAGALWPFADSPCPPRDNPSPSPPPNREALGRALNEAAQAGRVEEVRELLDRGAEPDFLHGSPDWTPLHRAARRAHSAVVSLLLGRGATVNARTAYGFTPLHVAAYNDFSGGCASALLAAGADAEARNQAGRTALHAAAECGNVEAVLALLEAGASRRAVDGDGKTPYDLAKTSCVRRLLDAL